MKSFEIANRHSRSAPATWSSAWTCQVTAPILLSSAPLYGRTFSRRLCAREMKGNFPAGSTGVVVTWRSAKSLRYSCRVRVAMAPNFSDLWAAFSALMTLANRKSLKTVDLGKVTPLGIGGPKEGTSWERVTATLQREMRGLSSAIQTYKLYLLNKLHNLYLSTTFYRPLEQCSFKNTVLFSLILS